MQFSFRGLKNVYEFTGRNAAQKYKKRRLG